MFEGSKTPLNIFVEIWILQILMSFKLNFWYQQTVYILMAWKDPYGGLQNPYFLELQQKNVAAGENCPYVTLCVCTCFCHWQIFSSENDHCQILAPLN